MASEHLTDINLVARILDNMPNAPEFCVSAKEIAGFLRHQFGVRQEIPKNKINPLLYHLKDNKELELILVEGRVNWYRTPEKGEKKWEGNIKKRLSVAVKKSQKAEKKGVQTKSAEEELSEEELINLAKQISIETMEKEQRSQGIIQSKLDVKPLPSDDELLQTLFHFQDVNNVSVKSAVSDFGHSGLTSSFIINHQINPGTRYGKSPFSFEEVLFWYQKHSNLKFQEMSTITGASLAILKKDKFVYLFKERPEKVFNMPGGKREIDESPYETLVREAKEEGIQFTDNFITDKRFPDIITIGINTETRSYGYNWTWVISEDKVILPDKEHKWVVPSEYQSVPEDASWVHRVMTALNRRGLSVYRGESFTTWLMVFQFKMDGVYDSVISMKIPWNNMV
jgi:hypothetical protein